MPLGQILTRLCLKPPGRLFLSIRVRAICLRRISTNNTLGRVWSSEAFSTLQMSDLAKFLAQKRAEYLQAVADGKGKDWTVVMGNEAGGKFNPSRVICSLTDNCTPRLGLLG